LLRCRGIHLPFDPFQSYELGDYLLGYLYYRLLLWVKVSDGLCWTLLTIGVLSGVHGLFLYGKGRRASRAARVRQGEEEGGLEVVRREQLGRHVAVHLSATVGGHPLSRSLAEEVFRILRVSQDNQRTLQPNGIPLPSPTPKTPRP
jgi:hypothetical protein